MKTLTRYICLLIVLASASSSIGRDNAEARQRKTPVLVDEHKLDGQEFHLTQVTLYDQTDRNDKLVRRKEHRIADNKSRKLTGSIFVLKNVADQQGLIFVRQSPMPDSRPVRPDLDVELQKHQNHLTVKLYRYDYEPAEGLWHVIPFKGGELEHIQALQKWERSLRPDLPLHQIPSFISNTWGDRSRDSRISETFILKEIQAAKEVGIDVVRIDDGWQLGLSGNSAFKGEMKTKGLSGFWGVSSSFWSVNPERFPNGLKPVLDAAKEAGVEIGLWYAPDSDNELANWEKDAKTLLALYETHGIRHFKIDGLDVVTPLAQERVYKLLKMVTKESNNNILLMQDVTGNHKRPGFLGAIPYCNIFVENRYTDKGSYWPHRTLKNLWQLSHWVHPGRLRFETLNNTRNTNNKTYKNNPLAPANYPADYLFASVMMSNPLGWYEISNLPEDYRTKLAPLVKVWRKHRREMFESSIIPIGEEPSGRSWTGFMTLNKAAQPNYLLFLREFTDGDTCTYTLPRPISHNHKLSTLHGNGVVTPNGNKVTVKIKDQPGYVFVKIEQDKSSLRGKARR